MTNNLLGAPEEANPEPHQPLFATAPLSAWERGGVRSVTSL
jgi:hypothetical protein